MEKLNKNQFAGESKTFCPISPGGFLQTADSGAPSGGPHARTHDRMWKVDVIHVTFSHQMCSHLDGRKERKPIVESKVIATEV